MKQYLKSYAYLYNDAGQRTFQIDENGKVTAYSYDEISRIKEVNYPFGSWKKSEDFHERLHFGMFPDFITDRNEEKYFDFDYPRMDPDCDYDDFENSLKDHLNAKDTLFSTFRGYDKNRHFNRKIRPENDGNEFVKKLKFDGNTQNMLKEAYSLISGNRGFNANQWVWAESFTYDPNSNIKSKSNGWGKINYSYENTNALLAGGNRKYEYDQNGNLIKENWGNIEADFEYNPENRVTDIYNDIEGFFGHNNWKLIGGVSYEYDAFGRRSSSGDYVKKSFNNRQWDTENNINYMYDGFSMDVLADFFDTDFNGTGKNRGWFGWWGGKDPRCNIISEYIYGNGRVVERTDFEKSDRWLDVRWMQNKIALMEFQTQVQFSKQTRIDTYGYDKKVDVKQNVIETAKTIYKKSGEVKDKIVKAAKKTNDLLNKEAIIFSENFEFTFKYEVEELKASFFSNIAALRYTYDTFNEKNMKNTVIKTAGLISPIIPLLYFSVNLDANMYIFHGYNCGPRYNNGMYGDENATKDPKISLNIVDLQGNTHDIKGIDANGDISKIMDSDYWLADQFLKYTNPFTPITTDKINEYKGKEIPIPNQVLWKLYSLLGYLTFSAKAWSEKNQLKGK
jgi:YD repeat-containing protein